jgi:hypothetical protein
MCQPHVISDLPHSIPLTIYPPPRESYQTSAPIPPALPLTPVFHSPSYLLMPLSFVLRYLSPFTTCPLAYHIHSPFRSLSILHVTSLPTHTPTYMSSIPIAYTPSSTHPISTGHLPPCHPICKHCPPPKTIFDQSSSKEIYRITRAHFEKLKEVFLHNGLKYNNLSHIFHRCHGLGETRASLSLFFRIPYFPV